VLQPSGHLWQHRRHDSAYDSVIWLESLTDGRHSTRWWVTLVVIAQEKVRSSQKFGARQGLLGCTCLVAAAVAERGLEQRQEARVNGFASVVAALSLHNHQPPAIACGSELAAACCCLAWVCRRTHEADTCCFAQAAAALFAELLRTPCALGSALPRAGLPATLSQRGTSAVASGRHPC